MLKINFSILWLLIRCVQYISIKYFIFFLYNFKNYNNIIYYNNFNLDYIRFFRVTSWSLFTYNYNINKAYSSNYNILQSYTSTNKVNIFINKYSYFLKKKNIILKVTETKNDNKILKNNDLYQIWKLRQSKHNYVNKLINLKINSNKQVDWINKIIITDFFKKIKYLKLKVTENKNTIDMDSGISTRNDFIFFRLKNILSKVWRFGKSVNIKQLKNAIFSNWSLVLYKWDVLDYIDLDLNTKQHEPWYEMDSVEQSYYIKDYSSFKKNIFFYLKYNKKLIYKKKYLFVDFYKLSKSKKKLIYKKKYLFVRNKKRRNLKIKLLIIQTKLLFKKILKKKLKFMNKNTTFINLNKYVSFINFKLYKNKHKVIKIKKTYTSHKNICLTSTILQINKLRLYYADSYLNTSYPDIINDQFYSTNWRLNNFLIKTDIKASTNRYPLHKYNFFTYYFNITSYKLFFNLLLIYPFLLINYANKNLSLNKAFFKNTQFTLTNPHDLGDDRTIYHTSMYVEIGSFLEHFTSKNVNLLIYKNNFTDINSLFKLILNVWIFRIKHFYRTFEYKFDLSLVIKLMYLSIKNKDIHLLMKLITTITPKIPFKKQRKFFKFIIFMFRTYFSLLYPLYNIQGYQFEFRGKISVDGNARTRKMYAKIVRPSPSNYTYSTRYIYKTVNTYTGVLGLKLWIYYCH